MYINSLPSRLVRWFSHQEYLSDCVFVEAHPRQTATRPVTLPTVSIGSGNISVEDITAGEPRRSAVTGFVICIHVPSRLGGAQLSDICARLVDALLFGTGLEIGAVHSEPVRYIRNTDTIMLRLFFAAREELRQTYEWEPMDQ